MSINSVGKLIEWGHRRTRDVQWAIVDELRVTPKGGSETCYPSFDPVLWEWLYRFGSATICPRS